MQSRRTPLLAALATGVALVSAAPAAHAMTLPSSKLLSSVPLTRMTNLQLPVAPTGIGDAGFGRCGTSIFPGASDNPVGTNNQTICNVGGLLFVGPSSVVSTVVGPTVISPGFAGTIITSGGNVGVG